MQKPLLLLLSVISMSSFANETKAFDEKNIYGSWNCKDTIVDKKTKMTIKFDYNITYIDQGKSYGSGSVFIIPAGFSELKYHVSDRSTWSIKEGNLNISSTDFKLQNVSYPELEKILNLKSIFPKKISESVKILELTKFRIKVQSKRAGKQYTCFKTAV